MKTTIYDIAKVSGYSASTVSRALNNSGYCNPKTKAEIHLIAKKLNYRPSNAGRVLKAKKSRRILFCIPDILNPFYFEMIRGTTEYLDQHKYYAILCYTQHSEEEEIKYLNLLSEQYGDGLIMVSFDFNDKLVDLIRRADSPIVTTNNIPQRKTTDKFDSVYVDHIRAMYIATEHLIDYGHKNIAVVVGDTEEQTSIERLGGFISCLESYGIPYSEDDIFRGNYTIESGKSLAKDIALSPRKYTGIVCSNDLMSMGIISKLQEEGYKVPQDFSIVSLDNTDYAQAIHPSLTSVDMMQYKIGVTASELLIERLENKRNTPKVVRLEPELIIRSSTQRI